MMVLSHRGWEEAGSEEGSPFVHQLSSVGCCVKSWLSRRRKTTARAAGQTGGGISRRVQSAAGLVR